MRTTIDLPDDLFRRAKAEAALRGMKFKDYAAALFRQGLSAPELAPVRRGRTDSIPVRIPAGRLDFKSGETNADLFEILNREDLEKMDDTVRERHNRPA
jgi:hypothetical protein